jgi:hypothetical protein
MSRVLRLADAYDNLRYVVQSTTTIETVMPRWASEIMLLDAACEMPLAMLGNFSTGMQAATLLLFKYEDPTAVDIFIRMVRQDQGTKTAEGMDGVQQLAEVMKVRAVKSKRGRVNGEREVDDAKRTLTAFANHQLGVRTFKPGFRIDPVGYVKQQRQQRQGKRSPIRLRPEESMWT